MEELKKRINIIIEKTNTGYSAYSNDYPVATTAKDIPTLYRNLKEAFNLYFEESNKFVTQKNFRLRIDMKQFFKHYKVLNARHLAERIGMDPSLLSQYINGKKTPSSKQVNRILSGIHQIGRELQDISLV